MVDPGQYRRRALSLKNQDRRVEAMLVLEQGLLAVPTSDDLLNEFINEALAFLDLLSPQDRPTRAAELAAFLRARLATLSDEGVARVLATIDQLDSIEPTVAPDASDVVAVLEKELKAVRDEPLRLRAQRLRAIAESIEEQLEVVEEEQRDRFVALNDKLVDADLELARELRADDARRMFARFQKERGDEITRITSWRRPGLVEQDGACQRQLDDVRGLLATLQPVATAAVDTKTGADVDTLAAKLQAAGTRAAREQQLRYDRWALDRMRVGFDAANEYLGRIVDNEPKLGAEILRYFGDIDVRQLGPEAQRAYGEMFEHLFKKLDDVKSGDDISKPGTKLHVLKELLNRSKVDVTAF